MGGGIPIIRPLHQCLGANEIDDIQGILNGTTNFILTKMIRENMNFTDALSLAQKLGYAEADPTADVEVWTPAAKSASLLPLHTANRSIRSGSPAKASPKLQPKM